MCVLHRYMAFYEAEDFVHEENYALWHGKPDSPLLFAIATSITIMNASLAMPLILPIQTLLRIPTGKCDRMNSKRRRVSAEAL